MYTKFRVTPADLVYKIPALLACCLACFASSTFAQKNKEVLPWYQVEVILFTQTLTDVDAQEVWPSDIVLAYPLGTLNLREPPAEDTSPSELSAAEDGSTNTQAVTEEEPFTQLNAEEFQLNAIKNTLARSSKFRVMSHIAWRQPGLGREEVRPIVVSGGDVYNNHHEMEGTIALRVSRYLHLESNIWFTQFYPNYGQQSGYTIWPTLPQVPNFANIVDKDSDGNFEYETGWLNQEQSDPQMSGFGLGIPQLNASESSQPGYIVDKIVLNQQSRKMRTGELHYIDHPVIGIIAKITPWKIKSKNDNKLSPSSLD